MSFARAGVYYRLGKFHIYQHWLPAVVALSALAQAGPPSPPALATVVLVGAGASCIAAGGSALDDLQGTRDGIDERAYGPQDRDRNIRTKPLLLGELTEADALRFGAMIAVVGFAAFTAAALIAPHLPVSLLLAVLVIALAATQYSYGMKLSYHGCGELVLALGNAATLAIPYGFATGRLPGFILAESFLLMFWMAQVTLCSSVADVVHDRAAGRGTAVALLSDDLHTNLIAAVFAGGLGLTIYVLASGIYSPWLALALVPAWALQATQLGSIARGRDWLRARRLGWRAYDLAAAALIVTNLLAHP